MTSRISKSGRRVGVLINYSVLVLLLISVYVAVGWGWNVVVASSGGLLLIVFFVSFFIVHMRTGLWQVTHVKIERLDERQIQVAHEALRKSYGYFTVICLLFLFYRSTS